MGGCDVGGKWRVRSVAYIFSIGPRDVETRVGSAGTGSEDEGDDRCIRMRSPQLARGGALNIQRSIVHARERTPAREMCRGCTAGH